MLFQIVTKAWKVAHSKSYAVQIFQEQNLMLVWLLILHFINIF